MSIQVKVYDNGDHTCLVWLTDDGKPIPQCRGFTARRLLNGAGSYLHGFVGFSDTDTLDPSAPWKFPLQRFMWWDYGVKPGDKVQYSIVPVVGPDHNHLELAPTQASARPCGGAASQRSPPWGGSAGTTSCRTASCHAPRWPPSSAHRGWDWRSPRA